MELRSAVACVVYANDKAQIASYVKATVSPGPDWQTFNGTFSNNNWEACAAELRSGKADVIITDQVC